MPATTAERRASGWVTLLVVFGLASTIEPIYLSPITGGIVGAIIVRSGLNSVLWTGAAVSLLAALLTTMLPRPLRASPGPGE